MLYFYDKSRCHRGEEPFVRPPEGKRYWIQTDGIGALIICDRISALTILRGFTTLDEAQAKFEELESAAIEPRAN